MIQQERRRKVFSISAALAVGSAVALTACSSGSKGTSSTGATGSSASTSAPSGPPVKLAWIGDVTGPVAALGNPTQQGFKTYISYINKQGGVNGHQIVVDYMDDTSDVSKARLDVQQAISNGDIGIYGGMASQVWTPLAASAAQNKVLELTVGVNDNYVNPPQPYIYRSQLGANDFVNSEIGFVKQYLIPQKKVPSTPRVAVFMYSSSTTQTMDKGFKQQLPSLGWSEVADPTITTTATDASSQASQIAAAHPDVVLAAWLDSDAPLIMKALRSQGYNGPVVDFVGGDALSTFKAINDPTYYAQTTYVYPTDSTVPGAVTMLQQAQAAGTDQGTSSPFFTQGYVQAIAAVDALKKCGSGCTGPTLNSATESLGTVDTFGLGNNAAISTQRHVLAGSSRFYAWNAGSGQATAVGPWIDLSNP